MQEKITYCARRVKSFCKARAARLSVPERSGYGRVLEFEVDAGQNFQPHLSSSTALNQKFLVLMNIHRFSSPHALQVLAAHFITILFVCCALAGLSPLRAQNAAGVGLIDSIDIADAKNERAHAFASSGDVKREIVGALVGDHDTRHLSRTVRGEGSWLSFQLRVDPAATTTLEIEERNGRDRDVRGYTVLIDNRKTYLRTWQSNGAGPLHFFVQFPPTGRNRVTVKFLNASATPFSISRLWSFAAFNKYFGAAEMDVPYYLSPMLRLNVDDVEGDLARLNSIKTSLGESARARAAWGTWIPYASMSAVDAERLIDHALLLAQKSGLPVQLALDTWWASTPGGLDGKGGFWSDLDYQQVVYNATQKRYQLSIPNRWSSVPWLSLDNADLNAFKARRLRETVQYLAHRLAALRARDSVPLLLALSLDNEPVYWASGAAGLGSDLLWADFSAQTVAAAKKDGVSLDPRDGLSLTERHWLQRNMLAYQRLIAQTVSAALGNDATLVAPQGAQTPQDLLRHNVYTQAWIADGDNQYPMQSSVFPLWESAAPAGARIGGEWNGDSLRENGVLQHMIALGRNAAVNAETGNKAEENAGVLPGYALGQRFYTPYNYPLDKMDVLTEKLRPAQTFVPHLYLPTLRENNFRSEEWKKQVAAWEGLEAGLINAVEVVNPASTKQPGFLLYRVEAPTSKTAKQAFDALFLEFAGRAFVWQKQDESVQIRVLAGSSPDVATMREIGRVFNFGDMNAVQRMDLSEIARGQKALWVRIELHAPGIPETVRSWSSLYHVRFSTGWPAALTANLPAQDNALETVRAQNLLVSWRSDAEDALVQLTQTLAADQSAPSAALLQQARARFERGEYAAAYHLANQGLSLHLPAEFWIAGKGPLGPYPLQLEVTSNGNTHSPDEGVSCRLLQCTPQSIRLQLRAAEGRSVQVTC